MIIMMKVNKLFFSLSTHAIPILEDSRHGRSFAGESSGKVGLCHAWMGAGVLDDGNLFHNSEPSDLSGWFGPFGGGHRWAGGADMLCGEVILSRET